MKPHVTEELNMFLSNPNEWINSIELQVNQYLETSENPYRKYAKLAFDRAMEKYEKAQKSTFPELMLQQNFNDFFLLKHEFLKGEATLDYVLMGMDPVDASLCLLEQAETLSDQEYWQKLSETYVLKEFVNIPTDIIHKLFTYPKDHRESMMDESEYKVFEELPEVVTVYRAMSKKEYNSASYRISWTLSEEVAENFVERQKIYFGVGDSLVKTMEVDKGKIIAYLNGRNEEEVIVLF